MYRHMFDMYVPHGKPYFLRTEVKAPLMSCGENCAENCSSDDYAHVTYHTEEGYSDFVTFLIDLASKEFLLSIDC
jgi:hypothetical protein